MTLRLHYCLFDYVQRFAKGTPLPIGKIAKKGLTKSQQDFPDIMWYENLLL